MAIELNKSLLYPEEYIIEEDLQEMGETNAHNYLILYLLEVLAWFYRSEQWVILFNVNTYHSTIRNSQHYIVPDLSLTKVAMSADKQRTLTSWNAEQHTPEVVFEVSSRRTWQHDVLDRASDKPAIYGRMGVREYYAYDPHRPQVWARSRGVRLRGWRYENGQPIEMQPDEQGRLWSEELNSYLVPDGYFLRLTSREGQVRLTEREFQAMAAQKEAAARHETEQRAEEAERKLAELERQLEELRRQQNPS